MFSKRLQILLTPEQHRALGERAKADGASIGQVVREAIDEKLRVPSRAERMLAAERLIARGKQYSAPTFTPEQLNAMANEEVEQEAEELHGIPRRRRVEE